MKSIPIIFHQSESERIRALTVHRSTPSYGSTERTTRRLLLVPNRTQLAQGASSNPSCSRIRRRRRCRPRRRPPRAASPKSPERTEPRARRAPSPPPRRRTGPRASNLRHLPTHRPRLPWRTSQRRHRRARRRRARPAPSRARVGKLSAPSRSSAFQPPTESALNRDAQSTNAYESEKASPSSRVAPFFTAATPANASALAHAPHAPKSSVFTRPTASTENALAMFPGALARATRRFSRYTRRDTSP